MPSKYTPEERYKAALALVTTGNSLKASDLTGIPASTIRHWSNHDDDFIAMCQEIWVEYGGEIKANLAQIIKEAGEQALDRIRKGDVIRDPKTGELVRVPMKGKDLIITKGIAFDKLRIAENQPTQIIRREDTERELERLADHFRAIAFKHQQEMDTDD